MTELDRVLLYERCESAHPYLQRQWKVAADGIQLFTPTNSEVQKHAATLEEIKVHVNNSDIYQHDYGYWDSDCEADEIAYITSYVNPEKMRNIVACLLHAAKLTDWLSTTVQMTQDTLLASMRLDEVRRLASRANLSTINSILEKCRKHCNRAEDISMRAQEIYESSSMRTEDQVFEFLVECEYMHNKTLNKFEHDTDHLVRSMAKSKFPAAWEHHLDHTSDLRKDFDIKEVKSKLWKEKYGIIDAERKKQAKAREPGLEIPTHNEVADLSSGIRASEEQSGPSELSNIADETVNHSPTREGNSQIINDLAHDAQQIQMPCSLTSASHEPEMLEHVKLGSETSKPPLSTTQPPEESRPLEELSSNLEQPKKNSVSENANQITIYEDTSQPNLSKEQAGCQSLPTTPGLESSFTFISKREYEHNKENTPVISIPPAKRDSYKKAFVGLDKYAQDLFAKSPTTKSPQ